MNMEKFHVDFNRRFLLTATGFIFPGLGRHRVQRRRNLVLVLLFTSSCAGGQVEEHAWVLRLTFHFYQLVFLLGYIIWTGSSRALGALSKIPKQLLTIGSSKTVASTMFPFLLHLITLKALSTHECKCEQIWAPNFSVRQLEPVI